MEVVDLRVVGQMSCCAFRFRSLALAVLRSLVSCMLSSLVLVVLWLVKIILLKRAYIQFV